MTTDLTTKPTESTFKKWRRRAMIGGVVLAVVCKSLPPEYQVVCEAIASICTAGVM